MEQGLGLNPNDGDALAGHSHFLMHIGRQTTR